ncbi:MAG: class I SAM-dependent methyltransferase [Gemmatimonadota bacterium]
MDIRSILDNAVTYVREQGLRGYAETTRATLIDRWCEWRLGIDTSRGETMDRLGVRDPDAVDYVAIPYAALTMALRRASPTPDSCFLDYGAGRGRAVVTAARHPFRRVIGVELSPELASAARANLARAKGLRCRDVVIVEQNALGFEVPDDVDLVHFFKPFKGETLRQVLDKLEQSYFRRPRRMTVIFFNDQEFSQLAASRSWLRRVEAGICLPRTRWPIVWGLYRAGPD